MEFVYCSTLRKREIKICNSLDRLPLLSQRLDIALIQVLYWLLDLFDSAATNSLAPIITAEAQAEVVLVTEQI
jgi:hypothetical protein